jgi:hypothetical protein
MTILAGCKTVDDFVEGAVAAAGDDQAAAFVGGSGCDFGGVARAGRFREIGMDAAGGKNMAGGIKRAASAIAAAPGVGVVY